MTRTLILMRHAKSSRDDPALDDFDRPLNARGREAAPVMGRAMARRRLVPDFAIVSPSLRTRQTFALVCEAVGVEIAHRFEQSIYEAPPERILAAIRGAPADAQVLLVLGHNPGMEATAALLADDTSDREARARLAAKYPTGALAVFEIGCDWHRLAETGARLVDFIRPRDVSDQRSG